MKIFVFPMDVCKSDKLMSHFLNKRKDLSLFILLDDSLNNHDWLNGDKYFEKITRPELSKKEEFLRDYIDFIGEMTLLNKDSIHWMASDIPSKNRVLSPILPILNSILFFIYSVDICRKRNKNLYVFGASWPIIEFIKLYSKKQKVSVNTKFYFLKFYRKFLSFVFIQLYLFRSALSYTVGTLRLKFSYKEVLNNIDKKKPLLIIKSFVFQSSFKDNNKFEDPFFPGLEDYLKRKTTSNFNIVTILQGFSDRGVLYNRLAKVEGQNVMPIDLFITVKDIFSAWLSLFVFWSFKSIKVPENILFNGLDISVAIRELVKMHENSISFGDFLYYFIACRINKYYNVHTCYITYEGNHWESMFMSGMREHDSGVKIIGVQHSAMPQAAAGIFVSCKDVDLIPKPDKIITTGKRASEILRNKSCISRDIIFSGCALRYQYLYGLKYSVRESSKDDFKVLVILGDLDSLTLFTYVLKQAEIVKNIDFIIRPHPKISLIDMLHASGMSNYEIPSNVIESKHTHVKNDIENCNAVLYWSSTVALEAIMLGKPVIYFDRGDALNFDPMSFIEFEDLKWTIKSTDSISTVIYEIINLKYEELIPMIQNGRNSVIDFFSKRSNSNMHHFIPSDDGGYDSAIPPKNNT